jgi:hypothetical protein
MKSFRPAPKSFCPLLKSFCPLLKSFCFAPKPIRFSPKRICLALKSFFWAVKSFCFAPLQFVLRRKNTLWRAGEPGLALVFRNGCGGSPEPICVPSALLYRIPHKSSRASLQRCYENGLGQSTLKQQDIPQNVAAILRTCLCALGFVVSRSGNGLLGSSGAGHL